MKRRALIGAVLGSALALAPRPARALPVAYVGTTAAPVVAHTGIVVLMREGEQTIVSVQTNYDGPIEPFAMIVPAPSEVRAESVRTLPRALFDRVTALGAPRLVESWEEDPCEGHGKRDGGAGRRASHAAKGEKGAQAPRSAPSRGGPREAERAPSEYDVTVLTEAQSADVTGWLKGQRYRVTPELEAALAPYAQAGGRFLVARFDPVRTPLARDAGHLAMLPPLRFAFASERFELPLRIGLASSAGTQDLVVVVLARHQRYEAGGWDDLLAPTGVELSNAAAMELPSVYAELFDRLVAGHARAAVTEYVHDAVDCDPCAAAPLDAKDLLTLGADALPAAPGERASPSFGSGFVMTRMQLRYAKDDAVEDLALRAVPPLAPPPPGGVAHDDFQALFTVHHPFEGALACDDPQRGKWTTRGARPHVAPRLAFGARDDVDLAAAIKSDVPALGLTHEEAHEEPAGEPPGEAPGRSAAAPGAKGACSCALVGEAGTGHAGGALALAAASLVARSAKRRRRG